LSSSLAYTSPEACNLQGERRDVELEEIDHKLPQKAGHNLMEEVDQNLVVEVEDDDLHH